MVQTCIIAHYERIPLAGLCLFFEERPSREKTSLRFSYPRVKQQSTCDLDGTIFLCLLLSFIELVLPLQR